MAALLSAPTLGLSASLTVSIVRGIRVLGRCLNTGQRGRSHEALRHGASTHLAEVEAEEGRSNGKDKAGHSPPR